MTEAQQWISKQTGKTLGAVGLRVADILSYTYRGAHHIPQSAFKKTVNWDGTLCYFGSLSVCLTGSLDTFDFDLLTRLVLACHAACVRCEISGAAPGYLRVMFHLRNGREGRIYDRHPSPEEALETFRAKWPISEDYPKAEATS